MTRSIAISMTSSARPVSPSSPAIASASSSSRTTSSAAASKKPTRRRKVTPDEPAGKSNQQTKGVLHERGLAQDRQKEAEFPVTVARANYRSEKPTPQGQGKKYDRTGLYNWARFRFGELAAHL